jgi:arginase family enzyme
MWVREATVSLEVGELDPGAAPLGRARKPGGDLRRDPGRTARQAAAYVAAQASDWWLHVDLDVLDGAEFRACAAASDPSMPEGLTWAELTEITSQALHVDGCRGWSIGVYNADLDPGNEEARRIVAYIADVVTRRQHRQSTRS